MALEIKNLTIRSKIVHDRPVQSETDQEIEWSRRRKEIIEECLRTLKREMRSLPKQR